MSTTFSLVKPLTASTAITHSVSGQFLGGGSSDLVVVRTNRLEVYSLAPSAFDQPATLADLHATEGPRAGGRTDQTLLHRFAEQQLFGNVEGACLVRLPGWTRDALLLTYPHSKLSLVAWDVGTHDFVTLAIWSQDEDVVEKERERQHHAARIAAPLPPQPKSLMASHVKTYMPPVLRVDPTSRCAALMTFDAYLNIFDLSSAAAPTTLPKDDSCLSGISTSTTGATSFYAHAALAAAFSTAEGVGAIPSLASPSTYSLAALGLGAITDMQFLHGFEDPTLLILHERLRTWEGRYAARPRTQEMSCVTFHLRTQGFSLIGNISDVAHDAFAVHPIPMPLGGALVLQQNLVLHWNNNALDYALAVNEHGLEAVRMERMSHGDATEHVTKLDRSRLVFLSVHPDRALAMLATAEGLSFLLHVHPSGASVRSMQLEALGLLPPPEGLVRLQNPATARALMATQPSSNSHNVAAASLSSFVFAFSRLGPALLLEYRRAREEDRREQQQAELQEMAADAAEKKAAAAAAMAAAAAVATAAAEQAAAVKLEQEKTAAAAAPADSDLAPIRSLAAQLDAASDDVPDVKPSTDVPAGVSATLPSADVDVVEPPAKRSKLDEMYHDMMGQDIEADEMIDLLGFGRAGESAKEEATAPKPVVDEVKQAEAAVAQVAADQEAARRERLNLALRGRKELLFFVRDRLTCSAPASDLTLGYALPSNKEEAYEEAEQAQAAKDETMKRNEKEETKPANEEEERAAAERERLAMVELERSWRDKERQSRVVEFVQLVGHAETGAVTIATEGIMPDIITEPLPCGPVVGCWALHQDQGQDQHALLLNSTAAATALLQVTPNGLQPVAPEDPLASAFHSDSRTLVAGNTFAGEKDALVGIVQVYRTGLRLIQRGALVRECLVPATASGMPLLIDSAVVESPYVLLRLSDRSARLFTVTEAAAGQLALAGSEWKPLADTSAAPFQITSACLFKDTSVARALKQLRASAQDGPQAMDMDEPVAAAAAPEPMDEMDDLERLLGGGDEPAPVAAPSVATATVAATVIAADHYLVLARDAAVEFYSLPSYELVYTITRLPIGQRVLQNADPAATAAVSTDLLAFNLSAQELPAIVDLCVAQLCPAGLGLPALFAVLDNGDLLAYEAFVAHGPQQLKWLRVDTPTLARPFLNTNLATVVAGAGAAKMYRDAFGVGPSGRLPIGGSRFRTFGSLGLVDKSGVLMTGTKPFLFLRERGRLRCHAFVANSAPREEEGLGATQLEDEEDVEADEDHDDHATSVRRKMGLVAVTPFHTPYCPHGLIFFDTAGLLHMCLLPTPVRLPCHPLYMTPRAMRRLELVSPLVDTLATHSTLSPSISLTPGEADYDRALVTRTIHLGATPVFISRHTPTSTTAVVLAYPQRIPSLELESERSLPQYENRYEVVLFNNAWDVVARYTDFRPHEMVLCMAPVRMAKKMFIVVGTSDFQGEDRSSRGRIILIDLHFGLGNTSEVDADGMQRQTKLLKMKVYTQEEKLPVTHVAQLSHNVLATGLGSKIILYKHTGKQLVGVAFIDTQTFITSITCLNHFILYGDERRGLFLLYWDPVLKTLQQLGRSHESFSVTACEFMIDHRNLNLVSSDEQGNLAIYKFTPNTPSAAANRAQIASYENAHVAHNPTSTQTLKESAFTGTSLLGGLGYKLSLKNDMHLGERVSKMLKMKLRTRQAPGGNVHAAAPMESRLRRSLAESQAQSASPSKLSRQLSAGSAASPSARPLQSYLLMASYTGAYSQLMPLDPLVFHRLNTLVVQMTAHLKHIGGLNPIAYRLFQSNAHNRHPHSAKKLLDGHLLLAYPQLSVDVQWELARHIGTTPAQVIEHIKQIVWATQCH